jgi:hypothetical protein
VHGYGIYAQLTKHLRKREGCGGVPEQVEEMEEVEEGLGGGGGKVKEKRGGGQGREIVAHVQ